MIHGDPADVQGAGVGIITFDVPVRAGIKITIVTQKLFCDTAKVIMRQKNRIGDNFLTDYEGRKNPVL